MLRTVKLDLPDQLFMLIGSTEKIANDMYKLYVLDLVRQKAISSSYGADLLGLHLTDFVEIMAEYNIPYFTESPKDPDEVGKLFDKALSEEK